MKRGNYLDYKTRSPDPDDLSAERPAWPPADRERQVGRGRGRAGERDDLRPNPDSSAPHIPPPED